MAIDVSAVIENIVGAGGGAAAVALAWTIGGWWMKAVHLLQRSDNDRNCDANRDWDDKASTDDRWYS